MAPALFDQIHAELFHLASIVDLRGWGESTILKTFKERIQKTTEAGPRIRLVTNALAIDRSLWDLLMACGASVVVSVDASTSETMRRLERGSHSRLMASLKNAVTARERHPGSTGEITFNTVLSSFNIHELTDIVRIAGQLKVPSITVFPVVSKRSDPMHLDHCADLLLDVVNSAAVAASEEGVRLRFGASLHEDLVVPEGLPDRCSHPWEYCYISYNGDVGYCDHLIGNSNLMLGNLLESSFEDIWNGERFQDLRLLHASARRERPGALTDILPHCAWCYMRRYVDFEDETHGTEGVRAIESGGRLPLIQTGGTSTYREDFMSSSGTSLLPLPKRRDGR
jgi:radical SAM protein with 4Fe4S-binding SPASM domain